VTLAPWEYLFIPFNSANFPDIFHPTWIASLALLVVLVILYNVTDSWAVRKRVSGFTVWEGKPLLWNTKLAAK